MSKVTALKTATTQASVPTHMLPISELYLAGEAPAGADLVVRDSGRGSPLTDDELKASIYKSGIIHALIWKDHAGKKYVVAGNRRLKFLREIFADALSTPVKTEDVADYPGNWRDVAMDSNLALPAHMVERFEMIDRIAREEKLKPEEVCARYGMSDSQYRRVMALAHMAPVVRQAWKDAKIDAKTAQAFTLEPDAKEQEKIFNTLSKGHGVTDWNVRRRIVPQTQQEIGTLVAFVGLDAVRKAKLLKQEDLFAGDNVGNHIVTDIGGLKKLAGDKMAKACDGLVKAGWSWALRSDQLEANEYQYGELHPDPKKAKETPEEKARLKEIERLRENEMDADDEDVLIDEQERIEQEVASRGFSDTQKAKGGCILKIGHGGDLVVIYGKTKPADKAKVSASERREMGLSGPAKPKKKVKPGEVLLTNALAGRLSAQLEKAIAESIPAAPHVAVAAIIAGFASSGAVVNVDVGKEEKHNYRQRNETDRTFLQVFEGALKSTPEQQAVMLAKVAAEALDIQVSFAIHKQPSDNQGLQALVKALPKDVVNKFVAANFNAKDYFEGVGLQAIVAAVRCSMGDEHGGKVAKMKKGEAAKFATAHLPAKGYLPPALRTAHYKGPVEKAAAKKTVAKKTAKKASKAKAKK